MQKFIVFVDEAKPLYHLGQGKTFIVSFMRIKVMYVIDNTIGMYMLSITTNNQCDLQIVHVRLLLL